MSLILTSFSVKLRNLNKARVLRRLPLKEKILKRNVLRKEPSPRLPSDRLRRNLFNPNL